MTIQEFRQRFPDDDACLDRVFALRFPKIESCPKCQAANPRYYRLRGRKCYECGRCGNQIYPLAGTVMHGSTTDLTKWFYAIFMFATSKNGVSGKELQRALGVTYKTAWRIGHKVRELMRDDGQIMEGIVEVDESLIGGRVRGGKRGWDADNKTCVFGMVERGGRARVTVVEERNRESLFREIKSSVAPGAMIYSDEYRGYRTLDQQGYGHRRVVHSRYQWADGDCHTNGVEGYWSNLKKSILGTHTFVSAGHLQRYLDEFSFRHTHRGERGKMFDLILGNIVHGQA